MSEMLRARANPPIAPDIRREPLSSSKALILEGMRLPARVEALGLDERPMIWSDLTFFEAKYGRTAFDMVYDLGVNSRAQYQRDIKTHVVLPFDMELLMRIYDMRPSSCSWMRASSMREVFWRIYGEQIQSFPSDLRPRAQIAYGARFSRLLGRAPTVQYRWLVDETSRGTTSATRRVGNIVTKLMEEAAAGNDPRLMLERLSTMMWHNRGLDIDAAAPAYDPITLRQQIDRRAGRLNSHIKRRLSVPPTETVYEGGAFLGVE